MIEGVIGLACALVLSLALLQVYGSVARLHMLAVRRLQVVMAIRDILNTAQLTGRVPERQQVLGMWLEASVMSSSRIVPCTWIRVTMSDTVTGNSYEFVSGVAHAARFFTH